MKIKFCDSGEDYEAWMKHRQDFKKNPKWQQKQVKHFDGKETVKCDRHQLVKKHKLDAWSFFYGLAAFLATVFSFSIAYKRSTTIREWLAGKEVVYVDVAKASPTAQKVDKAAQDKKVIPPKAKEKPAPLPKDKTPEKKSEKVQTPSQPSKTASTPSNATPGVPVPPRPEKEAPRKKIPKNFFTPSEDQNTRENAIQNQIWTDLFNKTREICLSVRVILRNKVQMRFSDVLCPEETAIQVQGKYLHANKVTMPNGKIYIASQAPMKGNEGLWWRGALQETDLIIDLSSKKDRSEVELDRDGKPILGLDGEPIPRHSNNIVQIYYPTVVGDKGVMELGNLKIKCTDQQPTYKGMKDLTLSTYEITDQGGKPKTIQRLHYDDWGDYGATAIRYMHQLAKIVDELNSSKPPFIHCRAGVGRTGTFITAISNKHLIYQGVITNENALNQTREAILRGRRDRSDLFVQTRAQLRSLILFNQHYLNPQNPKAEPSTTTTTTSKTPVSPPPKKVIPGKQ